jgi:anaerobic selenocysteine-containing dehydrogenase
MLGLDEVVALATPFPPERVAEQTGVSAHTIRRMAEELAHADHPVLYSRISACTQEFGTLSTWLVFVINAAIGALDRTGGAAFPKPAVWSPMFMKPPDQDTDGWQFGRVHSRVRGLPEVFGQFPISCLAEETDTPSGRIDLYHAHLADDVPRLLDRLDRGTPEFVLTSRRHLRSNNSWLHNVPALMRGKDRCTLMIHPVDAQRVGLRSGDIAEIATSEGAITVTVEDTDEVMPGVVCLPHGWGHGRTGTRLDTANAHPGVNSNLLNPAGLIDVPSNTQVVNGVPCTVRAAAVAAQS